MTTDVEQIILQRLDRIEMKMDGLAEQVAEVQGARKFLVSIGALIGGIIGAVVGHWSSK